jgi:hypothetical protein
MNMRNTRGRGWRNIAWIERHCLVPHGPEKGQVVRLTRAQRDIVYRIYDGNEQPEVTGPLAAFLALLHVCGPEALQRDFSAMLARTNADTFTVWNAVGPRLREVLKRDGERIVCPALGTRYPEAA